MDKRSLQRLTIQKWRRSTVSGRASRFFLVSLAILSSLALPGCTQAMVRPLVQAAPPSERTAQITLGTRVVDGGFKTQAIVPTYYTKASIYHLVIRLSEVDQSGERPVLDASGAPIVVDVAKDSLDLPVSLSNLLVGRVYRIRCEAYQARGTARVHLISGDDAGSFTDVLITQADAPIPVTVTVRLKDSYGVGDATVSADPAADGVVTTLAGGLEPGRSDGLGETARFTDPAGMAVDSRGNLFVADAFNHRICKIGLDGTVATFAGGQQGYADGQGTVARFRSPFGLAIDRQDNLYVADTFNSRIRKISPTGLVTTVAGSSLSGHADGPAAISRFNHPFGVAVDSSGNVYVADSWNHRVRKINPNGDVTTEAGSGQPGLLNAPRLTAQFNTPCGVVVDATGNVLVADTANHVVRKLDYAQGTVVTYSGNGLQGHADGQPEASSYNNPWGLAVDGRGVLYVADASNHRIRRISPGGVSSTLAGNGESGSEDGIGQWARFNTPSGLALAGDDTLYASDTYNHRIRLIQVPVQP